MRISSSPETIESKPFDSRILIFVIFVSTELSAWHCEALPHKCVELRKEIACPKTQKTLGKL